MTIKTKKNLILVFAVIFIGLIIVLSRNHYTDNQTSPAPNEAAVSLETYRSDAGWGYRIIKQGTVYIDQKHIPAIQGNIAFKSKEDAEKIGEIVKQKVINLELPHISIHTLDSLKIEY